MSLHGFKDFPSAVWYVYDIILGSADRSAFHYGEKDSQSGALYTLYAISSFIMLIHLTNMLIAIMGETFGNRREVAD